MNRWIEAAQALWEHFQKGFLRKRLVLKAGALSYTTVLCLLPLLAVTINMSNMMLAQMEPHQVDRIIDGVMVRLVPQIDLLEPAESSPDEKGLPTRVEIRQQIKSFFEYVGSGEVGAIGVGFLIFLSISLVVTLEHTFNDIWNVHRGRSWMTRITLYWSVMTLGLILFLMAIALTGRWQSSQVARTLHQLPLLERTARFLTPFGLFWGGLTLFYMSIPNTKVRFWPALVGGLFGGMLLQLNVSLNTIYFYQIVIAGELYGAFGIIPIFLVGLYVFWLFVLTGAQLSYSVQTLVRASAAHSSESASSRTDLSAAGESRESVT